MTGTEFWRELLLPFLGTALGAGCALFAKGKINRTIERLLMGLAAGVMLAACIWSLLIPSIREADGMGRLAFLPAVTGLLAGVMLLALLDTFITRLCEKPGVVKTANKKLRLMTLAMTLHNIPEGMAVGVMLAALTSGAVSAPAAAFSLSLGIAVQNFPEGAIISLPFRSEGLSKGRAFLLGAASGAVEPVAALLTLYAAGIAGDMLKYLLGFAAGAMLYVLVEELIPEMNEGEHSHAGMFAFALGFALMIALDIFFS